MTFEEALHDIESHEFAAHVNLASDLATFLRIANDHESVRTLLSGIVSIDRQKHLLSEVLRLSRLEVDIRYENPWDSALAVFLWVLSLRSPRLAPVAAEATIQTRQCWWALRVAHGILRESLLQSTQASERHHVVSFARPVHLKSINVGERILWSSLLSKLRFPFNVLSYMDVATEPVGEEPRRVAWQADAPGYAFNLTSQAYDTSVIERVAA